MGDECPHPVDLERGWAASFDFNPDRDVGQPEVGQIVAKTAEMVALGFVDVGNRESVKKDCPSCLVARSKAEVVVERLDGVEVGFTRQGYLRGEQ